MSQPFAFDLASGLWQVGEPDSDDEPRTARGIVGGLLPATLLWGVILLGLYAAVAV